MFTFTSFSDPASYPPLKVEHPNPEYAAQMLANAASCNSEMTAISMYLYDSVVLSENAAEISNALKKMAVVEMHHLDIFLHLAFLLGADPRLWSQSGNRPCYWSPACGRYLCKPIPILEHSLQTEQDTIRQYRSQACHIRDAYIADLLNRIILDEQVHVQILKELLDRESCRRENPCRRMQQP